MPQSSKSRRRRVLVAVAPPIFEELVAGLLRRIGLDEVLVATEHLPPETFDAAIISRHLHPGLDAGVVIELPDDLGHAGIGTVRNGNGRNPVEIGALTDLLALLDHHCPAPGGRMRGLPAHLEARQFERLR